MFDHVLNVEMEAKKADGRYGHVGPVCGCQEEPAGHPALANCCRARGIQLPYKSTCPKRHFGNQWPQ